MTAEQIYLFVRRLLLDDVTTAELASLPSHDLLAVTLHLVSSRRDVEGSLCNGVGSISYGSAVMPVGSKRVYSEKDSSAELGVVL